MGWNLPNISIYLTTSRGALEDKNRPLKKAFKSISFKKLSCLVCMCLWDWGGAILHSISRQCDRRWQLLNTNETLLYRSTSTQTYLSENILLKNKPGPHSRKPIIDNYSQYLCKSYYSNHCIWLAVSNFVKGCCNVILVIDKMFHKTIYL